MKQTFKFLLIASAFVSAAQSATAQLEVGTNYASGSSQTDQFNVNNGYVATDDFGVASLDGQPVTAAPADQWQTTDPYNNTNGLGSTSSVEFIQGTTPLTTNSGNNSVIFGGYYAEALGITPGITNPSLYFSFLQSSQPAVFSVPGFLMASTFSVDFNIVGPSTNLTSNPLFTNRDYFGFSLLSFDGTSSLAEFRFNPFTPPNLPNFLDMEWIQNGTNVAINGTSYTGFRIEYNTLYRLTATITNATVGSTNSSLNMSISGLVPQSGGPGIGITNYAVVTNQNVIVGGDLTSGLNLNNFGRVSIDWELGSGNINTPGMNYMMISSASIISQAIPETGTWAMGALLLLGVGAYAVRRRGSAQS